MARYTFKSEENEYGYYNKVRFDSEGWEGVVDQFVVFLRGEGYVIGHNDVIQRINDLFNEYIETESKPLSKVFPKSEEA